MKARIKLTEEEVLDVLYDHVLGLFPEELAMADNFEMEMECEPGDLVAYAKGDELVEEVEEVQEEVEQPW